MKKYAGYMVAAVVLAAAGLFFRFALRGYSFTAYAFFGAAAVVLAFMALRALKAKKPKLSKTLALIMICGLLIFAVALTVTECIIVDAAKNAAGEEADCLLVLGAGVNGTSPSLSLVWRLRAAKEYLEKYPSADCIVSGGQGPGEDITEAECMRRWLEDAGVQPERIIMEDKSATTDQNIRNSFVIADEMGYKTVAVLTADYHVCRASSIAMANGKDTPMVAAKTEYHLLRLNYYFREAFALWYYKLFALI